MTLTFMMASEYTATISDTTTKFICKKYSKFNTASEYTADSINTVLIYVDCSEIL